MCLYFKENPEFARKCQTRSTASIFCLNLYSLLDARENNVEGKTLAIAVENPLSNHSVSSATCLVGKHIPENGMCTENALFVPTKLYLAQ